MWYDGFDFQLQICYKRGALIEADHKEYLIYDRLLIFTENQLAVRDMAREVAARVVEPKITESDRAHKVNPEVILAMANAKPPLLFIFKNELYSGVGGAAGMTVCFV